MTEMNLHYDNRDGIITIALTTPDSADAIRTTLKDTDDGMDVRTVATLPDGREEVLTDKLDRNTAPLVVMLNLLASYQNSFLERAQAGLNRVRYERLLARGGPISMADMCMDGMHRDEKWKNEPFRGHIVGVPEHHNQDDQQSQDESIDLGDTLESELRDIFTKGE
jgi:hypothetical protein